MLFFSSSEQFLFTCLCSSYFYHCTQDGTLHIADNNFFLIISFSSLLPEFQSPPEIAKMIKLFIDNFSMYFIVAP